MDKQTEEYINDIRKQERKNTGTSWTRNELFDKNGFLFVKNLWDPKELYTPPQPKPSNNLGLEYNYYGKTLGEYTVIEKEDQVQGSLARYHHPQYRQIHSGIRLKIEKIIGRKLYNTYYYDRIYYPGQSLKIHVDRNSCEISVTVNISTNLKTPWPICVKSPDIYSDYRKTEIIEEGKPFSVNLNPGDGMIYKGCERPHWREPMPTEYEKTWYGSRVEKKNLYYHQIFFHYVLADGIRSHFAWDRVKT